MLHKRTNLRGQIVARRRIFLPEGCNPIHPQHGSIQASHQNGRKKQRVIPIEKRAYLPKKRLGPLFSCCLAQLFHSYILPFSLYKVKSLQGKTERFLRSVYF